MSLWGGEEAAQVAVIQCMLSVNSFAGTVNCKCESVLQDKIFQGQFLLEPHTYNGTMAVYRCGLYSVVPGVRSCFFALCT